MRFIKISKINIVILLVFFLTSGIATNFLLPVDKMEFCAPHEVPVAEFERCNHCDLTECKSVFKK